MAFAHGLRFNTSDVVSLSCALLALEPPMSSKAATNAKSNVRNDLCHGSHWKPSFGMSRNTPPKRRALRDTSRRLRTGA